MIDPWLELIARWGPPLAWRIGPLFVYLIIIALVHELGHAVLARPAGFRLTSVGLGTGPVWARFAIGEGRVFALHRWVFAGGACVAIPEALEGGRRAAWFHAGGVLAQLGLAVVLRLLPPAWDLGDMEELNGMMLLGNVLPWRWGGQVSDGWWLLMALRQGGAGGGALAARRAALLRLGRFERARGSVDGAAWAALLVGWADRGDGALQQAQTALLVELRPGAPPVLAALRLALALELAPAVGPDTGDALRGAAESAAAIVDPAARALVCGAAARLALRSGDREAAERWLNEAPSGHDGGGLVRLAALELALARGAPTAQAAQAVRESLRGTALDPSGARAALARAA